MLEENLKDLLNAGIGLFKIGEKNIQEALNNFQKVFDELKVKGSEDNSDTAVKLREMLSSTIRDVQEASQKAETNMNRILEDAKKNSSEVLQQIKRVVGEGPMSDFNTKMEEIAKNIQNTGSNKDSGTASAPSPSSPADETPQN